MNLHHFVVCSLYYSIAALVRVPQLVNIRMIDYYIYRQINVRFIRANHLSARMFFIIDLTINVIIDHSNVN